MLFRSRETLSQQAWTEAKEGLGTRARAGCDFQEHHFVRSDNIGSWNAGIDAHCDGHISRTYIIE